MHELAATQHLLRIALRHAEAAHATRITQVHLVIGQLSTMIDDSVQFYWDIITEGTLAAGSELQFTRIPARLRCDRCRQVYEMSHDFLCPTCAVPGAIISGDEFLLEAIEVEGRPI